MTATPPRRKGSRARGRRVLTRVYPSAFARPFKSAALEHAFRVECSRRFASQRQAMIVLGAFAFLMGALFATTVGRWFEHNERVASAVCAIAAYLVLACAYWQMRLVPTADAEACHGPGVMVVISHTLAAFRLPVKTVALRFAACLLSSGLWILIETRLRGADLSGQRYACRPRC